MKSSVLLFTCLLFAVAYAAVSEEEKEHIKEIHDECAKELGMETSAIKEMFHKLLEGDEHIPKEFACFKACMMKKLHFMDGHKIMLDNIRESIMKKIGDNAEGSEVLNKLHECHAEVEGMTDPCDVAGKMALCMLPTMKKVMKHE